MREGSMSTVYRVEPDIGVNVRAEPGGVRVGGLPKGTLVEATGGGPTDAGGHTWLEIRAQGSGLVGWVARELLAEVHGEGVSGEAQPGNGGQRQRYRVASDIGVNVRAEPDGTRVGGLPDGAIVVATGEGPTDAGGHTWLRVQAEGSGLVGWVAREFLDGPIGNDPGVRDRILAEAAAREGTPYQMPPDGVDTLDCSLFVLYAFRDAGVPFPDGVRTAQQIRTVCDPIADGDTQPGDLVFFQNTYPAGPGVASHVGISLGAGIGQMWDCHAWPGDSGPPGVTKTNIRSDYWTGHWLEAGRPRQLG